MDKQQTILIADDESQIRKNIAYYFEKEGFKVIEAADGAEAMYKRRQGKPDIFNFRYYDASARWARSLQASAQDFPICQ